MWCNIDAIYCTQSSRDGHHAGFDFRENFARTRARPKDDVKHVHRTDVCLLHRTRCMVTKLHRRMHMMRTLILYIFCEVLTNASCRLQIKKAIWYRRQASSVHRIRRYVAWRLRVSPVGQDARFSIWRLGFESRTRKNRWAGQKGQEFDSPTGCKSVSTVEVAFCHFCPSAPR